MTTPLATSAQSWTGGANLGVQVKASKGGAVAGATVEVRHRRPGGSSGPDSRMTDSRGQHRVRWPIPPNVQLNAQDVLAPLPATVPSITSTNGVRITRL